MGDLKMVVVLFVALVAISRVQCQQQWPVGVSPPAYPGNGSYSVNIHEMFSHLKDFQVLAGIPPFPGFLQVMARL